VQTSVHMLLPERASTVAIRFAFFFVQVLALLIMGLLVVAAAR